MAGCLAATVGRAGRGDADGDRDIDLADVRGFQNCFLGPQSAPPPECVSFLFDGDTDVDLDDYAVMSRAVHGPGVLPPVLTDTALILGRVFHAESGAPLEGVRVTAVFHPAVEGEPDLPPVALTGADGRFEYETVPVEGMATFLLRVRKDGFAENLRRVEVLAGRCWRVDDAFLNPVTPPVMVSAEEGGMLADQTGQVTIEIPPGALERDSEIGVTSLATAKAVRDDLPALVADSGSFIDVSGVFGDATKMPVTMRVPNHFNLPLGTRVRFGKIDHNTLEWTDLRDAFGGGGQPDPDVGIGIVRSNGQGGTYIEVKFDHFCTVCTGYCLPYPPPGPPPINPPPPPPPPPCPPPGPFASGSSVIDKTEGHLWEFHELPSFRELGRSWRLTLVYYSSSAVPSVTLRASTQINSTRPVERTQFEFDVEGNQITAIYDFREGDENHNATFLWDGRDALGRLLPTGSYAYEVSYITLNADAAVSLSEIYGGPAISSFEGLTYPGLTPLPSEPLQERAALLNRSESPYGAGWSFAEVPRLHLDPDGCVLAVDQTTRAQLFVPRDGTQGMYDGEDGAFSTLSRDPVRGSFTQIMPDGTTRHYAPNGTISRITDRGGYNLSFTHSTGKLTAVTSPTGFRYELQYENERLSRITDSAGRETLFEVDQAGDLVTIISPTGAVRTFGYDTSHRLTRQEDARGGISTYSYRLGRVVETSAFDTDGVTLLRRRRFAPSVFDGEIATALAKGQGTLLNPAPLVDERVDVYTDGRGETWRSITSDDGLETRFIDPLGRETIEVREANGLLIRRTRPNGSVVEFDYDAAGRRTLVREVADGSEERTEYEGPFGLLSRIVSPRGFPTLLQYDSNGALVEVEDADGNITRFEHGDPRFPDMPTRVIDAAGFTQVLSYDAHGNVLSHTDALSRTTTFARGAVGNRTRVIDARGVETLFGYDERNRLVRITNGEGETTRLSYNDDLCDCGADELTAIAFANNETARFEYDGLGRRTATIDPLGRRSSFTFDAEGNRTSWTNRADETVEYTYDRAGQLTRKEYPGGEVHRFTYGARGDLVTADNDDASLAFEYDARGRLIMMGQTLAAGGEEDDPEPYFVRYAYDAASNRRQLEVLDTVVEYGYTDADRLSSVAAPFATVSFVYDAFRLADVLRGNDVNTHRSYDEASQIASIRHESPGGRVVELIHSALDGVGNLTTSQLINSAGAWNLSYQYDDAERLTAFSVQAPLPLASRSLDYLVAPGDRLVDDGRFTYAYDNEGRVVRRDDPTAGVSQSYHYDADGLLRAMQEHPIGEPGKVWLSVAYAYDALGRRVAKTVNGVTTQYVYDGANLLLEIDSHGIARRTYLHGLDLDEPLAAFDVIRGEARYFHVDRLGSVAALSDPGGEFVQEYVYDAFGTPIYTLDPGAFQPLQFAAREVDRETGLMYFRARYYDPVVGRFLSQDPMGFLSETQSIYAYALNNPTNFVDPDGRQTNTSTTPPPLPGIPPDFCARHPLICAPPPPPPAPKPGLPDLPDIGPCVPIPTKDIRDKNLAKTKGPDPEPAPGGKCKCSF